MPPSPDDYAPAATGADPRPLAGAVRECWTVLFRVRLRGRGATAPDGYRPAAHWGGGRDRFGRPHPDSWSRAAELLTRRGWSPSDYVRYVLLEHPVDRVTPAHLHDDRVVRAYEQSARPDRVSPAAGRMAGSLHSQTQALAAGVARAAGWARYGLFGGEPSPDALRRHVLLDESSGMTALFRYCQARREGLDDVADHYRDQAALQYLCEARAYDAAWGDLLPADLRAGP